MKTWFITGTSKGFGRIWAEAALKRGDNVAATARNIDTLSDLVQTYGDKILPIALDVTDKAADFKAVAHAQETFGQLDVIVNNAGYGTFGMVEELSEELMRNQLETNFFGALWITQAALAIMREQGSGHIIQITSIGGVNAFPFIGAYHASKWALEGLTQALAQEVVDLGIKVTLVEPGGYSTDWGTTSSVTADPIEEYAPMRQKITESRAKTRDMPDAQGNPEHTAKPMLELVDMDKPPLRLLFGKRLHEQIHGEYKKRLDEWDKYQELSESAH